MRIETDRLIITEFTMDMAQAVHENSLDEDNRRFVPDEVFETQVHPVITRQDGKNIGYVQMVPMEDGTWEIGYHIAKAYTGNGYATEAVKAFLPEMAGRVGISEVYGICLKENIASVHVLKKCGFEPVFEGIGDYQGEKREIFRSVRKI